MSSLSKCIWGPQARSIEPTSLWQIRLCDFIVSIEAASPSKSPKFDWMMYAGISWLGQSTLWGMETQEVTQIPNYSLQNTTDWRNKLRFLSCFLDLGGHIMKFWIKLQLLIPNHIINFYNLIENIECINYFTKIIIASQNNEKVTIILIKNLLDSMTFQFIINPRLQQYGCIEHHADIRLYAQQEINNSDEFLKSFSRWMILNWAVDLLPPTKQINSDRKTYKSRWQSLGDSIKKEGYKTSQNWFILQPNEIPDEIKWEYLYRDSVNPLKHLTNGKSSEICTLVYTTYITMLNGWASAFDKEFNEIENIICLKGSSRILNLISQMITKRLTKLQNYNNINDTPEITLILSNFLESNIINNY
jgi:hypothetical protein